MQYIVHLFEVLLCVLSFAFVYYVLSSLQDEKHFINNTNNAYPHNFKIHWIDAIYFSLVTQSTVGYGSIVPASLFAKCIVSLQVFSTIAFVLRWSTLSF